MDHKNGGEVDKVKCVCDPSLYDLSLSCVRIKSIETSLLASTPSVLDFSTD